MVDLVEQAAKKTPDIIAYEFYGVKVTYRQFLEQIDHCAKALCAMGIEPGEKVTICMPNTPQGIIMFYAINRMGAIANMIHPLSAEEEIVFYVNESNSVAVLTLSQFYPKFQSIREKLHIRALIITGIEDALSGPMKLGYLATQGRKIAPVPKDDSLVLFWKDFLRGGEHYTASFAVTRKGSDTAAILYSGGTTGTTKGILLSNLNFNALGLQTGAAGDCLKAGHKMLSIMPIFHGFGLGVCIHTVLIHSATCILVPQFTVESYAALLKKHKPNYIAGVPTLYEALLRLKKAEKLDLSQLEGIFSGGDSLSIELKHKVDAFLQAHGSKEQIREGYGTTECVTASCLTPKNAYHEGSIGIPFPDTYYKIVTPATHDEVPYGTVGEICISGPTVMQGYMNQPKETAQTLQFHEDGLIWLHTGDLGSMDEQGFIYFKQRLKRMIITSGYNVYPSQVENVIDAHEAVLMSTVIGVKDDYRMQRVKAFVVLRPGYKPSAELEASIREHCKKHVAKYAMPREIEFRDALPKTLVGKVAYTVLEREEAEKASAS
jgi:long-chain acyl-CoA synthetase